jgi:hypothetical protein
VPAPETNGVALAALLVGIGAVLTFWLCGLGAVVGLAALVLGILGVSRANKLADGRGKGQAISGIVLGAIAIIISVGFIALIVASDDTGDSGDVNTDPSNGSCNYERFMQDPDC